MSEEGDEATEEPWSKLKREITRRRNRERDNWHANQAMLAEMTASIPLDPYAPIDQFFETAPDWECPCCRRSKRKIAVTNKNGKLLLNLVRHHDHLRDFVWSYAYELAPEWRSGLPIRVRSRLSQIGAALRRFDPVTICQICNGLDVKAARIVRPPKFFSFSADEIGRMLDHGARYWEGVVKLDADRVRCVAPYAITHHEDVVRDMRALITALVSRAQNDESDEDFERYRTAGYGEQSRQQIDEAQMG